MQDIVIWLVGDSLRLDSNPALERAITLSTETNSALIPLAILEPRKWKDTQFGIPRSGLHWQRVRANSWINLGRNLRALGSGLWIDEGTTLECLRHIASDWQVRGIVTDLAISVEETTAMAELRDLGFEPTEVMSNQLFESHDLSFSSTHPPKTFTQFRKQVEKKPEKIPLYPSAAPTTLPFYIECPWNRPTLVTQATEINTSPIIEVDAFGGEDWARLHWEEYLDAEALSHYKKTRNAFSGRFNSSRLSIALAHGLLSPRRIWHDTLEYEKEVMKNDSTYWLRFELLWREFLHWYGRSAHRKMFLQSGPEERDYDCAENHEAFEKWKKGETGFSIVDACQKELLVSGWMSNRGRQLVASSLINELNLDWRLGAAWFESRLADFDVNVNWGNWAYIAGVGPDPRGGRHFHLEQQTKRYDQDGSHRAQWENICIADHGPRRELKPSE